jgi:hypothetical protein
MAMIFVRAVWIVMIVGGTNGVRPELLLGAFSSRIRAKPKELELKHHRISRNRRAVRNVLMASALAAVLAAGASVHPALAHSHQGPTMAMGNHAHHSGGDQWGRRLAPQLARAARRT